MIVNRHVKLVTELFAAVVIGATRTSSKASAVGTSTIVDKQNGRVRGGERAEFEF